jgi:membrane protein insertase Oxa1/YidC/SpoIIIJ
MFNLFNSGTIKAVGDVVDDLFTTDEERQQAKIQLEKIQAKLKEKQMDINLADAKSTATGISGILQRSWRPLIGMSCALAIFWEFVLKQFLVFFLAVFKIETYPLPSLDMSVLMPLVMALLGMAGIRTFEKVKKVTQ